MPNVCTDTHGVAILANTAEYTQEHVSTGQQSQDCQTYLLGTQGHVQRKQISPRAGQTRRGHAHTARALVITQIDLLSRPVLPDRKLMKGGSTKASGCQQHARAMRLQYVAWWWRSRERKPTRFGNGFGHYLASVSTSRQGSE